MFKDKNEENSKLYADPNKAFCFSDGTRVVSVFELASKLKTLDEKIFEKHVNFFKNDFAYWIKSAVQNTELARIVDDTKTRVEMLQAIDDYIQKSYTTKSSEGVVEEDYKPENETAAAIPPYAGDAEEKLQKDNKRYAKTPGEGEEDNLIENDFFTSFRKKKKEEPASEDDEKGNFFEGLEEKKKNANNRENNSEEPHDSSQILKEEDAREYSILIRKLRDEIGKVIIGQNEVIEKTLLCLLCDSHALLEGVPGLAKSLLVETLAKVIGSKETLSPSEETTFRRIQFLPDMLPSDVIGGQIYNPQSNQFVTIKGPIFANFVLADEINRAPPKTHAALMECMQEKKVTIDKDEFILDRPFLVLATENPLENKGTYSLPEAVLDRFMLKIILDYPARQDEMTIITDNSTTRKDLGKNVNYVISKEEFLDMQRGIKTVYLSKRIREYILDVIEATRGLNKNIEGYKFVKYGAGVRASIYLGIAAKARAVMEGRNYVMPQDIAYVSKDILRHRIALNFKGKAHNISTDKIVEEILAKVNAV